MADKLRSCGSLVAGNEQLLSAKAEPKSPQDAAALLKLKEVGGA